MVGDPKPPRAITSSVFARSLSFIYVAAARSMLGEAGGDVAALGDAFRGGTRQVIEVTPNDRPG